VRVSRIILVISILLLASRSAAAQGVTGRVTSSSGEPLAGVTIWNMPFEKATTAADGTFSLKANPRIFRFQMTGYRPITKFVDNNATIVMEKAADALWTPPVCKLTAEWFEGGAMAFRRPKNARLNHGRDIDYGTSAIRYKGNTLLLGSGFTWSWGYPNINQFFDTIAELRERDIEYDPEVPTSEYRGRRKDGTYVRFIGMFGATIEYDHATKEQADYFDAIMDTLCWVHYPYGK
jgi:hypothetical protein